MYIKSEQEKIIDTIHHMLLHHITNSDKYLNAKPETNADYLLNWIYFLYYRFLENDESLVEAIIYLNGKYFQFVYDTHSLQLVGNIEINEDKVKYTIINKANEIYDGDDIYIPNIKEDDTNTDKAMKFFDAITNKANNVGYNNLPF